jgi:hypothetical protein
LVALALVALALVALALVALALVGVARLGVVIMRGTLRNLLVGVKYLTRDLAAGRLRGLE